jgi:hypothetical protein
MSDLTYGFVSEANPRHSRRATPAMTDSMLPLPSLSPVSGKKVVVKFDGGLLSSDGGVLVLREVEQRLRVADRLAACVKDPRAPDQITHTLADIIRFRLLMITAGYEDRNDANSLRCDPAQAHREPGDRNKDAVRGRAQGRQGAPFQGIL